MTVTCNSQRACALLAFILLISSSNIACSQGLITPFTGIDVIKGAIADLTPNAGQMVAPLPFSRLATLAIAMEKSHAWKAPEADQLRQLLPNAQNKQCFTALQQLLADGDTTGAVTLREQVRAKSIPSDEMTAGIAQLRQAGLAQAADALTAVNSGDPHELIPALLRIPAAKRQPLETYLYDRNNPANNPPNYITLASATLRIYGNTPVTDKATCDDLLRFLTLFGFGSSQFNFSSVGRTYHQGNHPGALYMLQWLLMRFPDDTTLQAEALRTLLYGGGLSCTLPERVSMLTWMVTALKPHYGRHILHDLLAQVAANPKYTDTFTLEVLQRDTDTLVAAESYLAQQQYAKASTLFTEVATSPREPLPRRLAAWSGLWDANPDGAVGVTPVLTDAILALPAGADRTALIRWFGGEMGTVAPFLANGWVTKRPKATAPACYTAMAASMTRLLAGDPLACLRLENANGASLRYAAALVFTLAKNGPSANTVLAQVVEYKECPRPGTMYAISSTKLLQELPVTSPRLNETEEVMRKLVQTMEMYDKSFGKANTTAIVPESPNTTLIIAKCTRLAASKDVNQVKTDLRSVAQHLALSVAYLDPKPEGVLLNAPPPTPRHVTMASVKPIQTAIDSAFGNPLVCQQAAVLVQEGLQPAMLTASNPELLDALFAIATSALDKAVATAGKDVLKVSVTNYANYIEGRQVWNLKPYANQLRAKYLQ